MLCDKKMYNKLILEKYQRNVSKRMHLIKAIKQVIIKIICVSECKSVNIKFLKYFYAYAFYGFFCWTFFFFGVLFYILYYFVIFWNQWNPQYQCNSVEIKSLQQFYFEVNE